MQLTIFLATAILALTSSTSALPQPTSSQITVRISNDQSGAGANANVPADGVARPVPSLFSGSAIDNGGSIIGTSAQLVKFSDSTQCQFNTPWGGVIQLDGRAKNFAELDGDASQAVPVWLNGFTFQCNVA